MVGPLKLLLLLALSAIACAKPNVTEPTAPDLILTLNGAHRSILCLRPCESYLTVRLSEDAPEELLRARAISWDFGDGESATQDTYSDDVRYVWVRWHRFAHYGTFKPRVTLYSVDGRAVGTDTARVQIGASETRDVNPSEPGGSSPRSTSEPYTSAPNTLPEADKTSGDEGASSRSLKTTTPRISDTCRARPRRSGRSSTRLQESIGVGLSGFANGLPINALGAGMVLEVSGVNLGSRVFGRLGLDEGGSAVRRTVADLPATDDGLRLLGFLAHTSLPVGLRYGRLSTVESVDKGHRGSPRSGAPEVVRPLDSGITLRNLVAATSAPRPAGGRDHDGRAAILGALRVLEAEQLGVLPIGYEVHLLLQSRLLLGPAEALSATDAKTVPHVHVGADAAGGLMIWAGVVEALPARRPGGVLLGALVARPAEFAPVGVLGVAVKPAVSGQIADTSESNDHELTHLAQVFELQKDRLSRRLVVSVEALHERFSKDRYAVGAMTPTPLAVWQHVGGPPRLKAQIVDEPVRLASPGTVHFRAHGPTVPLCRPAVKDFLKGKA